ncbi:unnamed protein product [Closterium sp. NIES-53]
MSSVSALVTTVTSFASSHRLNYAAHFVSGLARSPCSGGAPIFPLDRHFKLGFLATAVPHLCALLLAPEGDPDALDIPIPRTHAEAVSRPWASYWIAAEEAEMSSYRSTCTYVDAVPPPGTNGVSGRWLYKVKWSSGSPPVFKARYVARGFSQREGVDFFHTFSPTPKMNTLRVLLHIAAQRGYELHSLDFLTAFLQGSLHEQIWLCRRLASPALSHLGPSGSCVDQSTACARLHQVPSQQTPEEAERHRLRLRNLPDPALARLFCGPLSSPPVPPVQSLSFSLWTRHSPLHHDVSPEPRRSHYRADGQFHLLLRSRVPPPPVLPQPPESSLTVLHDPLSDYLRASRHVVSRVLSALVTHPIAPLLSVSALVTTVASFASSHCLDYASHLDLEDKQFELGFLAATVPRLCAMLLAPEGDPDALDIPIPCNHAEAVSGPWASYLIAHEEAEMAYYRSTGNYVDVVPTSGTNVVSGMWLYKVRRLPGSPPVFKARYVARCFTQREGVDFFQTFAPTQKMTTLRGSLHEQIWLRRPPGFTGSFPPGTQWQLRWPVYGLRQAPREWHDTLRTTLAALDFFLSSADPSLFVRRGSTPFFVLIYVDNLVFATPDRHTLASVKEELQRRHTCTDLGELQRYLGLQITRDRAARTITLTQSRMVEQILTRFHFPFSKVQLAPLAMEHGLIAPPSDEPFESSGSYPELVGFLMYLMTCTRPNLAYPLSVLACFVAPGRQGPSHWYAAKRLAKYVASTLGMGLVLGGKLPVTLTGYSDSSWADDAESLSAVLLCEEPRLVGKAKHIQLRYFLVRELQQRGQALVRHVVSEANTADIFTKALPPCASEFAAALGASETATKGASESATSESAASAEPLHTFTLDSGASRCFFHDCTIVTPLIAPPGSSLYTLTTASSQVAALSQVSVSGQFAASCSCRVLFHQTLLWHHRLGQPSLPRLRCMHSRVLVSGLPRSLPPLPRSLAPPCLPCVEGRQRAAPHSSSFLPTTAPLQTLHMDVWSPAPVHGTDQERYFLPVVDDYMGGEFSSGLLEYFSRDEGIVQPFTLPASPQQNGIAECRIGLIMEVARTSVIHAAAPHLLWPFAVRYAAHQLNLLPRSALSLVRNTTASKLSPYTLRCAFPGFPTDAPPWQFYHPRSRRVLSSQDVTFDESVCFYMLHSHTSHPVPLAPLFLVPVPPWVDALPPQGPSSSGVSQVDPPPLVEPLVISSNTSDPPEGGDPAANDIATTRRSRRLEALPGFPPRPSSLPLQPVALNTGDARGGDTGGEDARGAGPGGAKTGCCES